MIDHVDTGRKLDLQEASMEGDDAILLLEKALPLLRAAVPCVDGMRELIEGQHQGDAASLNWCEQLARARTILQGVRDEVRARAEREPT